MNEATGGCQQEFRNYSKQLEVNIKKGRVRAGWQLRSKGVGSCIAREGVCGVSKMAEK